MRADKRICRLMTALLVLTLMPVAALAEDKEETDYLTGHTRYEDPTQPATAEQQANKGQAAYENCDPHTGQTAEMPERHGFGTRANWSDKPAPAAE